MRLIFILFLFFIFGYSGHTAQSPGLGGGSSDSVEDVRGFRSLTITTSAKQEGEARAPAHPSPAQLNVSDSPAPPLLQLPFDLIDLIVNHIGDLRSVISLSRTCTSLRDMGAANPQWYYHAIRQMNEKSKFYSLGSGGTVLHYHGFMCKSGLFLHRITEAVHSVSPQLTTVITSDLLDPVELAPQLARLSHCPFITKLRLIINSNKGSTFLPHIPLHIEELNIQPRISTKAEYNFDHLTRLRRLKTGVSPSGFPPTLEELIIENWVGNRQFEALIQQLSDQCPQLPALTVLAMKEDVPFNYSSPPRLPASLREIDVDGNMEITTGLVNVLPPGLDTLALTLAQGEAPLINLLPPTLRHFWPRLNYPDDEVTIDHIRERFPNLVLLGLNATSLPLDNFSSLFTRPTLRHLFLNCAYNHRRLEAPQPLSTTLQSLSLVINRSTSHVLSPLTHIFPQITHLALYVENPLQQLKMVSLLPQLKEFRNLTSMSVLQKESKTTQQQVKDALPTIQIAWQNEINPSASDFWKMAVDYAKKS